MKYPVLALRDVVVFPSMAVPLFVGREKSIAALEHAATTDTEILLVTQKDGAVVNPGHDDLHEVGTLSKVIQLMRLPDGTVKALVKGVRRVRIDSADFSSKTPTAEVTELLEVPAIPGLQTHVDALKSSFAQLTLVDSRYPEELRYALDTIKSESELVDTLGSHLRLETRQKQELLAETDVTNRLNMVHTHVQGQIEAYNVQKRIQSRVKKQAEKSQKEYYLNEQLNAIKKELGDGDEKSDVDEIEEKLATTKMPDEIKAKAKKELKKLKQMAPISAEAGVTRNYLDWMTSLPWGIYTEDDNSIKKAREVLNADHYGLDEVKERLIEYLAVRSLAKDKQNGTLICLSGPPGVGKCLGKDTPVIMFDGTTKVVQDVKTGDLLMGDDSSPRTVLSTVKGKDKLYKVKQKNGDDYVINSVHILSLKGSLQEQGKYNVNNKIDIELPEYLKKGVEFKKRMKGYKVPVEFSKKELLIDPYFVGYWLGNGSSHSCAVTFNANHLEVIKKITEIAESFGTTAKTRESHGNALTLDFTNTRGKGNLLKEHLIGYEMINNKHIPKSYLTSNRQDRLQLLAGLIDSDGHADARGNYEITQKNKNLADQIVFLSRSLGYKTTITETFKKCQNFEGDVYHRIMISSDDFTNLPVVNDYKKLGKLDRQRWYDSTEIEIEELTEGDYFGFEIDGNKRFLLGDFTVTHNTSIATSLASSLGRKFARVSLGGVRDEAEIRGHRRTYVGALPGKIIQALKKVGTSNPVILLDEIDKMSNDSHRGDPAAAMLEVLDPAQNKTFSDHYLEVDYDLSKVMFIMTANDLSNVPRPLLDRMEVIHVPGYTPQEKMQIAKRHLLPKAITSHGLDSHKLSISDEKLTEVVNGYTREAGVRNLERQMNTIARKIATGVVENSTQDGTEFEISDLEKYLGPAKFEHNKKEELPQIGLVNGLAWTSVGGDMLNIETITSPGTGKLQVTGKLGEVMQESAKTAYSYVRSIASDYGIQDEWFTKNDVHIHVPDGATPKDGPSAGITMATALMSAIGKIAVRQNVAMTGEISLRGKVMPIGGLKEKILAAKQAGITTVICPEKNRKDVTKVSEEIKDGVDIRFVSEATEVLTIALQR